MVCIYIICIPHLADSYEILCIPILLSSVYFQRKAFRYGGEEFAVLFVGKKHEEVVRLCELVMNSVRDTNIPEMPGQQLTMSIGLAPYNRSTMKKAWF